MPPLIELLFWQNKGNVIFLMIICYLVNGGFSFWRFKKLAVKFERYDFNQETKFWTTKARFLFSATLYGSLSLFTFRAMLEFPTLVEALANQLTGELWNSFRAYIDDDPWPIPILATVVLFILFFPGRGPLSPFDRQLRSWLQRMGSIPKRINKLMSELRDAEIDLNDKLMDDLKSHASKTIPVEDIKLNNRSTACLLAKACYYDYLISRWKRQDSPFFNFGERNEEGIKRVRDDFKLCEKDYTELIEVRNSLSNIKIDRRSKFYEFGLEYIDKREKNLNESIEDLLSRLYMSCSCALISQDWSYTKLNERLRSRGIYTEAFEGLFSETTKNTTKPDVKYGVETLLNDIGLMLLSILLIVYPASLLFSYYILGWRSVSSITENGSEHPYTLIVAWPVMVILITLAAITPPLYIKLQAETSFTGLWKFLANENGRHYFCYFISGLCGFTGGIIALTLGSYIDFPKFEWNIIKKILDFWPYGILSFVISICLSFFLDTKINILKYQALWEGLILGILCGVFGSIALLASKDFALNSETSLPSELPFVSTICFLIGTVIGSLIPTGYRKHAWRTIAKEQINRKKLRVASMQGTNH